MIADRPPPPQNGGTPRGERWQRDKMSRCRRPRGAWAMPWRTGLEETHNTTDQAAAPARLAAEKRPLGARSRLGSVCSPVVWRGARGRPEVGAALMRTRPQEKRCPPAVPPRPGRHSPGRARAVCPGPFSLCPRSGDAGFARGANAAAAPARVPSVAAPAPGKWVLPCGARARVPPAPAGGGEGAALRPLPARLGLLIPHGRLVCCALCWLLLRSRRGDSSR